MPWVWLDDKFPDHPKVTKAGGDAAWLYVAALAWVNRTLTSGFIPKAIVPRLTDRKKPMQLAQRLVDVGLWIDRGDDYEIHDYAVHNASAEEARMRKQRDSDRARKAAQARWEKERAAALQEQNNSNAQALPEHVPEQCSDDAQPMPHVRGHAPNPIPPPSKDSPPPSTSVRGTTPEEGDSPSEPPEGWPPAVRAEARKRLEAKERAGESITSRDGLFQWLCGKVAAEFADKHVAAEAAARSYGASRAGILDVDEFDADIRREYPHDKRLRDAAVDAYRAACSPAAVNGGAR